MIYELIVTTNCQLQHTESMIGDMWNFVNLGKRVDGCEHTLETVIIFIEFYFLILYSIEYLRDKSLFFPISNLFYSFLHCYCCCNLTNCHFVSTQNWLTEYVKK